VDVTQGRFWIGAGGATPMHVEWEAPVPPTGQPALILIHGGGGQGSEWLRTPDGRPGWAPVLSARGHPVYVVDRPGYGRAAAGAEELGELGPAPTPASLAALLRPAPEQQPTADPHTQWPGPGGAPQDDPVLAAMLAHARPMPVDLRLAHELERHAGAALLDRIGRAILITHSAGAPAGWLMADARPDLVRGIVALEPAGPPFRAREGPRAGLACGLTATPLGAGLRGTPVVLVSAQASPQRHQDVAVRDYLAEAGAEVQLLRLAEHGVTGNGHGMIFERNHLEVLGVVLAAIERITERTADTAQV
jgi:pimeloyl-ACP methyl ester carboxylesterase